MAGMKENMQTEQLKAMTAELRNLKEVRMPQQKLEDTEEQVLLLKEEIRFVKAFACVHKFTHTYDMVHMYREQILFINKEVGLVKMVAACKHIYTAHFVGNRQN